MAALFALPEFMCVEMDAKGGAPRWKVFRAIKLKANGRSVRFLDEFGLCRASALEGGLCRQ
jgi:hypothetical protein